jgi:hypothetical protein
VQRFFHGGIAELEPLLHKVDAQQGLHCKGLLTPASGFGRVRLYERDQFSPGHYQFHGVQELALAGALDCVAQAQAALLHARIVWASALRAIASLGDSCRESLAAMSDSNTNGSYFHAFCAVAS